MQPPAGAPGIITTYRQYYADAQRDPYNGQYADAMDTFHVPVNNAAAAAPALLASQVYNSAAADVPMAFLMLCRDPNADPAVDPGRVTLFHRQVRFSARLGLPATPWDNDAFAFKGEVHNRQIVTVQWTQEYFHQVNAQIRVATVAEANQQLSTVPPPLLMGPYANADAGTEVIRTRRTMYVPPRYVGLFLEEDLAPVEAYIRFVGAATADGTMVACAPLVDWLRAAITRSAAGAVSLLEQPSPTVPLADPVLLSHRGDLMSHDLPGLVTTPQQHLGMQAVAGQIGSLVSAIHTGQQDARTARLASQTKTPEQYFGPRLQTILRLCQIPSAAQLPPVYAAIANSKKKERSTIQQYMDESVDALSLGHKVIITPSIATKMANGDWAMEDAENLETGLHHFHFCFRTPNEQDILRRLVDTHSMVVDHGSTPSLHDAQVLLAADKVAIPVTWSQVRYTLHNMRAVSQVALGPAHPHSREMQDLLIAYNTYEHTLETMTLPPGVPQVHAPAYVLRWFQLRFSVWADDQSRSPAPVPVPHYRELFTKIRFNEYWLPTFPPGTLASPARLPAPSPAPAPSDTPRPAPTSRGAPAAATDSPPNVRLNNLAWKSIFQPYKAMALRVQDLKRRLTNESVEFPKRADGTVRCLAYHVKGMCNSSCGQKTDHQAANEADDQVLLDWCQNQWHA